MEIAFQVSHHLCLKLNCYSDKIISVLGIITPLVINIDVLINIVS